MSLNYTTRHIVEWPGPMTKVRQDSPFSAAYNDTLELLDRELRHLAAKNIIMQLAYDEGDIRLDGRPRARAFMRHPGVIITFNSKFGPLSYSTDLYKDWEANLRAIALALEALRRVDRYGVSKQGSQYQGYKRLDAGATTNGFQTVEEAAEFIAGHCAELNGSQIAGSTEVFKIAYKVAAQKTHPDMEGGDEEAFKKLQEAAAVLRKRFGL